MVIKSTGPSGTLASLGLVCILALSGCGTESPGSSGSEEWAWEPELRQILNGSTNDEERASLERALQNKAISREDYLSAVDAYIECMSENGYTLSPVFSADGIASYKGAPGRNDSGFGDAGMSCSKRVGSVEALYNSMIQNPNNDGLEKQERCLVETGIVDEGKTPLEMGYPPTGQGDGFVLPDELMSKLMECVAGKD